MGPFCSKMERIKALHQVQFEQSLLEDTFPRNSLGDTNGLALRVFQKFLEWFHSSHYKRGPTPARMTIAKLPIEVGIEPHKEFQ